MCIPSGIDFWVIHSTHFNLASMITIHPILPWARSPAISVLRKQGDSFATSFYLTSQQHFSELGMTSFLLTTSLSWPVE
jgi:hypothetical protein